MILLMNASFRQVGPRAVQSGRTIDLADAISMLTRFEFLGIKVGDRSAVYEKASYCNKSIRIVP